MKKLISVIILSLLSFGLYSQGIYNDGGIITVGSGAFLVISGTKGGLQNETGGNLTLSGTLKIEGDLINNASTDVFTNVVTPGTPEVVLSGSALQTIGGTSSSTFLFHYLTVNNPAGINLSRDISVEGILNFSNGLINIGSNNLTFGTTSTISGSPSPSNMIVAGSGQIFKKWATPGSFTFPVGDNNGTADFSPVTLNFTSGTFSPGAVTGINLVDSKYNDPIITGSYLNRYWNITQTGISNFSCDAVFQYVSGDVVGSEDSITALKFSNQVEGASLVDSQLHQFNETALNSFGTFTGGLGFRNLKLRLFLEALYAGNGTMKMSQGNSGNQFGGTVCDKLTIELHDPATYSNLISSFPNVDLNTDGTAAITLPVNMNGSYYLTIKHRNSIETVSSVPLLFSPQTITYDFTTSGTQAFRSNQKKFLPDTGALYAGDVNQDGIVDTGDMNEVDNGSTSILIGYHSADVNGDGIVDTSDMNIVDNNSASIITVQLP